LAWPVIVAGSETTPNGARRALEGVSALGTLDRASFASWSSRAAIGAFPVRYEPFGLAILETALAGAALVLGDIPSLRELWDGAALFVPPDDERALEAVLRSLIGDEHRRGAYAERARKRAERFSAERMAAAYVSLYEELSAARTRSEALAASG